MPAYKDTESGKWYSSFYYTDWTGERKRKLKRGFDTKKEALAYEAEYIRKASADMDMKMSSFVDVYFNDKVGDLKERTIKNKRYMIDVHIIPYLGEKPMNEVKPSDIIAWQNTIRDSHSYSQSYLRMLQNQMTALFNHAQKIYGLGNSPCKSVKKMGKSDDRSLVFWIEEEYDKFIKTFNKDCRQYVMFEILFWTGCRVGEMLALNIDDFDMVAKKLHITKTYYRADKKDIITTPKTVNSVRTIELPDFLVDEVKAYFDRLYQYPRDARLFPITEKAVEKCMDYHAKKAEVKKIRVHDLRHSHVAYLIHHDVQPLIIKERLGHKDIKVTLNTYGHLYPSEQRKVAGLLDQLRGDKEENMNNEIGKEKKDGE